MRYFYGEHLTGVCFTTAPNCVPFPAFSCHLLVSTKFQAAPQQELSGLPGNVAIPPPTLYGASGFPYNTRTDEGPATKVPYFFNLANLNTWSPRNVLFGGFYAWTYEGPSLRNAHCVVGLEDRNGTVKPWLYANRIGVYWTDAHTSNQTNLYGQYVGKDWLGMLWPGDFLYGPINMPQPLKAERFFEDSGSQFSTGQYDAEYNIMRWETPLDVYEDQAGTVLLGQYVGFTFIPLFGAAIIKDKDKPLPTDPTKPFPPGGVVTVTNQFVSLELWVYLAGVSAPGKNLKSPRIGTLRWWLPKADMATDNNFNKSWCDKYMYLQFSSADTYIGSFTPKVSFQLVGTGERVERRAVLSEFKAYLVA